MDQKIISAIQVANSASQFKAAVEAVPREQKYYSAQTRDLLLLKQKLITDSPTADCVTSLLYSFSIPGSMRPLLRTPEIRDLIINVLASQITSGSPVDNLGGAVCNIVQDKPAAELYSTAESLKAILSCFHRATTAESAEWIVASISNILFHNPPAKEILNDLLVVEAFSALLPHATSDGAIKTFSWTLEKILIGNDEAQKMFGIHTFFEQFKTMEKHATSDAAKASFNALSSELQSIADRRTAIEKRLRDAKTSQELISSLDSIRMQSNFWSSLVGIVLAKKHLITDSPTADSVSSFLCSFSRAKGALSRLRIPEIRDLIINTLAPKITSGSPVHNLGLVICNFTHQSKPSATLYSTPESLKAILSCFHRATTAEGALWIASSINNILNNDPSSQKLLNDFPVVEAFSALLPHATSDKAVRWVSNALQKILIGNDEAQKMFGIPTFFEQFKAMEQRATSIDAKTPFKVVADVLQPIVDRRTPLEKLLRDAKNSKELVSALDSIMKQADVWSSLVDVLLSTQRLIQDEGSTSSTAKFIKWCCGKKEKIVHVNEIYDLFKNVLLPNSLNFTNSVPFVHAALALIVKNNKEAQEFFSTDSLKVHVISSLPHADESLLKILNSLLIGSKKAQEVFGTPDFKKKIEVKFGSNVSQEFTNVMTILTLQIIQVRCDALKKLAVDHKEEIDEACLKKLAGNEIDVADFLVVDAKTWLVQFKFTVKQDVALTRLIQKVKDKNNGVPVHQDPFKLQELEQSRREHNDLRKLHQDLVTSSSKSIDDLKNQLQEEKKKQATTDADRDAKSKKITDLDQSLADERKTSRELSEANEKLTREHNTLKKLHQDHVTSSSKEVGDLEKQRDSNKHELDAEKNNHKSTAADRDAKNDRIGALENNNRILEQELDDEKKTSRDFADSNKKLTQEYTDLNQLHQKHVTESSKLNADLEKSLDVARKQLMAAQQQNASLQSQLDAISPFVRDKLYQIDCNVNNLPQPSDATTRHTVAATTRIFAEAQKLMTKGGALIYDATSPNEFKFSPVQGFTLQSVDVILRSTSGFEDRLKKLLGLRLNVTNQFNPAFAAFSPEQQKILKILFAHFLPRPPTANPKFPNLVNVFHGTRIDRLDAAMDGLRAMRSTDDGYFGGGCYTTTSIEYAAKYARGYFSSIAPTPRADGCYPVLWCVAAVGVCHPVSRADDYSQNRRHKTIGLISNFFGSHLNPDCDCHCAVVGGSQGYQAVPLTDMEYMEIVIDQEAQVIPIAVLWVQ